MTMTAATSVGPLCAPASSTSLTITPCTERDRADWDAFVASQTHGSFYQLFAWRDFVKGTLGHDSVYLAARRGGQMVGVLPLIHVSSRLFGRILCSMPFLNQGGPCSIDAATDAALCEAAAAEANRLRADYFELRCPKPLEVPYPFSLRKANTALDLQADPEQLFKAFSKQHRTNIKRAYKENFEVRSGGIELLPQFTTVIENLWRSLGTPMYRLSFFEHVFKTFPQHVRAFVIMKGADPAAAMLVSHFNGTAESVWGGSHPDFRHLDANYVLYWEMIQDACRRGLTRFNLGRSSVGSGGARFKLRWNATSEQQYWYFHRPDGGEMPQLNVDNPRYRLAIQVWKRLPLWMTRTIGPPLARNIP